MTEDTRRALKVIQPLADELGIKVSADDERLYMDKTAIGISLNSTHGTVMEALGYIFIKRYPMFRKYGTLDEMVDAVQRYWVGEVMDYETAIYTLGTIYEKSQNQDERIALDAAIKCMKMRVPRSPHHARNGCGMCCPECMHGLTEDDDICPNCGQWIRWN